MSTRMTLFNPQLIEAKAEKGGCVLVHVVSKGDDVALMLTGFEAQHLLDVLKEATESGN